MPQALHSYGLGEDPTEGKSFTAIRCAVSFLICYGVRQMNLKKERIY